MRTTQGFGAVLMACVAGAAATIGWLTRHGPEARQFPIRPGPRGTQCAHWCALRSCELVGIPVTLERVMSLLPSRTDGHSLQQLMEALRELGAAVDGVAMPVESLHAGLDGPTIVHLNDPDHFMVVTSVTGDRVHGFDGLGQRVSQHISSKLRLKRKTSAVAPCPGC